MNIKDVVKLLGKGISLDEIKQIKESDQADDLIQLVNGGLSFQDASDVVSMFNSEEQEEDQEEEQPSEPEPDPEDSEDYKSKYEELLLKTQIEKSRKDNSDKNEKSDEDVLKDLAKNFF